LPLGSEKFSLGVLGLPFREEGRPSSRKGRGPAGPKTWFSYGKPTPSRAGTGPPPADFRKAADIIKNKEHLNSEGFNEILKIKSGMNQNRQW